MGRKLKQAANSAADEIHLKWLKHKNAETTECLRCKCRERVLCRRVGLYVRMAGSARHGCGAGAGLEDHTRAGINVQLNVCYNKKLSYNVVVAVAWIAHAEL